MNAMNQRNLSEREIKDLLTPRERPAPPADLADRIKREIPADISVASGLAGEATTVSLPRSRVWLLAASVMVAVGGGFFALRLMEQMQAPGAESTQVAAETPNAPASSPEMAPRGDGAAATGELAAEGGEALAAPAPAARTVPLPSGDLATRLGDESAPAAGRDRDDDARQAPLADAGPNELRVVPRQAAAESGLRESAVESEESAREPARRQRGHRVPPAASPPPPPAASPPPPAPPRMAQRAPASPSSPAPPAAPPVEFNESVDAETDLPQVDALSQMATAVEPEPEIVVTSESPVVGAREKKVAAPREARTYSGRVHGNARIESSNAKIAEMREESRQLEEELRALEQSRQPRPAPPSTGGTAEPNDAPYGDVFFDSAGTNPFIDTEDDALSTFGLDVDTGSYTVARRYLRDGHLPPPEAVRVEEFINYLDYGDPAPEKAEFAIHAEGAPSIYGEGESESYYLLRFNLSGRELSERDRRPALLTFVVDVSGSMERENRIVLVQQALLLLIDQLRSDDRLALVIYGSRGQVVLEPTSDHRAIRHAIKRLRTGGSTNAEEGLVLAYELAARHRRRGAINRVILCSDGVANVGHTSADSILERIRREASQGIELTTVGFGMGNYNDTLMERLADTGNGRYAYVDALDEARRIFALNLTGTLQTLAAEARVQVEFDPGMVSRYRLLGYENRDIADHRFRDPTVDAGEIGVGHKVTALYEVKLKRPPGDRDRIATLRLRYGSIESGEMVELERAVTGADFARRWQSASPALKLTSLVAEYAEILKRAYWAREGDLDDVFRRAQRLSAEFAGDREVADFVSLVGRAAEYKERESR